LARNRLQFRGVAVIVGVGVGLGAVALVSGVRPVRITTSSMAPAVGVGQWVVVTEAATPSPGDAVLFRFPLGTDGRALKRVVATAGDRVEVSSDAVVVNGRRIPLAGWPGPSHDEVLTVPDGHLYLLGDNHARSVDSRSFGSVPEAEVVAEVLVVIPRTRLFAIGAVALATAIALAGAWKRLRSRSATEQRRRQRRRIAQRTRDVPADVPRR
jgi:signal peptidase I